MFEKKKSFVNFFLLLPVENTLRPDLIVSKRRIAKKIYIVKVKRDKFLSVSVRVLYMRLRHACVLIERRSKRKKKQQHTLITQTTAK